MKLNYFIAYYMFFSIVQGGVLFVFAKYEIATFDRTVG